MFEGFERHAKSFKHIQHSEPGNCCIVTLLQSSNLERTEVWKYLFDAGSVVDSFESFWLIPS